MPKREIQPVAGLYRNGARWWVRTVRGPLSATVKPLSTGTTDVGRANAVKAMVDTFSENPKQYQWLELALVGDVSLDQLYTHHAAGSLPQLRAQLDARHAAAADADLGPWVEKWIREHLPALEIKESTRRDYARQIRYFFPEGTTTPKSGLTEDFIKDKLMALTGAKSDRAARVSGATRRRYLAPLAKFIRYARKRVPLDADPLADADWLPANGSPRMKSHTHAERLAILDRVTDEEHRAALALVYGSGIELGALLAMKGADVLATQPDGRGLIIAHGTKNGAREDRTIYVDAWAWKIAYPFMRTKLPRAQVWSAREPKPGQRADWKELREAFYWAQHEAGLIEAPVRNERTRKYLWSKSDPHTIHDARHTYVEIRSLGLDGEPAQDITFCSHQLGHADETMVMRVYKKKNIKERQRAVQLQQTQKAAVAAGGK